LPKTRLGIDVLTAAQQRVEWTFDNFPRVYLSFSAGKDSTVMLHLVAAEARKRGRRFGMLLVDLEGQYKCTIEHATRCYEMYADCADPYWVALPISLRNAVSVYEPKWLCWDPDRRDVWIREPSELAIADPERFPFFRSGMEFEEFVPEFGEWYSRQTEDGEPQRTACLVGIRADESLNRFRTIASTSKTRLDGKQYTSLVTPNVYNVYPIYDWRTQDLWAWHGRNPEAPYNRLYDLMGMAGLTINQMRICQPYGDDQRRGLWLFHLIEPETWARVVARVNGANGGPSTSRSGATSTATGASRSRPATRGGPSRNYWSSRCRRRWRSTTATRSFCFRSGGRSAATRRASRRRPTTTWRRSGSPRRGGASASRSCATTTGARGSGSVSTSRRRTGSTST
jgi:predicted phosphoadenosine phosphosulfate sulfurtransferase